MFSAKFEGCQPNKAMDIAWSRPRTLSEQCHWRCLNMTKDVVWTRSRTSSQIQQGQGRRLNKVKDVQSNPTRPRTLFEQDLEQDQGCFLSEQDPGRFSRKVKSRTFSHSQGCYLNEAREKLKVSSFLSVTPDCYNCLQLIIYEETICVHFLAVCGCSVR